MGPDRPGDVTGSADDPACFEDVVRDGAFLRDFCTRIVGDPVTAEDIVQETFIQAFRHLDRLERRESFTPWLATVARRRCLNELRGRGRTEPVGSMAEDSSGTAVDPADIVQANEMVDRVLGAFAVLNTRERHLLTLQIEDRMSVTELAACDKSTESSVKSVLNRARAKLRAAVEGLEVTVLAPVGVLLASFRRYWSRVGGGEARQFAPMVPNGFQRFAAVTGAAIALVLGTPGALPSVSHPRPWAAVTESTEPAIPLHPESAMSAATLEAPAGTMGTEGLGAAQGWTDAASGTSDLGGSSGGGDGPNLGGDVAIPVSSPLPESPDVLSDPDIEDGVREPDEAWFGHLSVAGEWGTTPEL